jgi:FAD/FMN-containing dehydrogenase
LTLNGGIGWLRNKYGLSCDNLVSAEVVTADGALITASANENADLFWALRGGGGNFGVVTSFEFKLHPLGPMVAASFPMYAMEHARAVLQQWHEWVAATPDAVTSELVLWTMPAAPDLPPAVHGQAVIIAAGVYAGPPDEGAQVLQPLREFGTPLGEITGTMPFRVVQSAFDPFFPTTGEVLSYWKSLYTHTLSDEVIEIVTDRGTHRSSPETMIVVQHFGGAVRRVPPHATAFATREAPFIINFMGTWRHRCESKSHIAWVRDAWNRVFPYSTGTVYLNYLGQEERDADALVGATFGPNYDRLVAVKTRVDPTNLFRLNQNIKPTS